MEPQEIPGDALLKYIPMRQDSFFSHLNLDIRNMIYEYIELYPTPSSQDWRGFILSCHQAKEEVDGSALQKFHEYLRTLPEKLKPVFELPAKIVTPENKWKDVFANIETLTISASFEPVCFDYIVDDLCEELCNVPCQKVRIHFNSPANSDFSHSDMSANLHEAFVDWILDLGLLPLGLPRIITVSWNFLDEGASYPTHIDGLQSRYKPEHQLLCTQKYKLPSDHVWPLVEEFQSKDEKVGWKTAVVVPMFAQLPQTHKLVSGHCVRKSKNIISQELTRPYVEFPW
ncbi:hypothetical protein K505DRAFT_377068 [Melanomma pulvis-pyrius CBS 109.77]|uniref:Uncharacterized protein n=1 Tax=Melanomma pulvis-pyrius CBS 109.77 TaxID=1314802 RepID=A0A6A6X4J8_9PLEO|nr:hypothetical protein K505DRAFT_377068 [Melanomma pulvis-pyrius CBS 109.77]